MLIGEVRLSELALPLHEAETALGMRVSPTLMSVEEFQERLAGGDCFLRKVLAGEPITLWDTLELMVFVDRDLATA